MTDQEREAKNAEDRKWLDKMAADLDKLRHNREKIPLQELRTRYARAYNTLVAEIECDADWFAQRYREALAFPFHPKDTQGREWVEKKIATILEEEKRPGGRVERYRAALVDDLDREAFEHLVWEIYERTKQEAYLPYFFRHCRWVGPPDNRWIFNDILQMFWLGPERREPGKENGYWITSDRKGYNMSYPAPDLEDPEKEDKA